MLNLIATLVNFLTFMPAIKIRTAFLYFFIAVSVQSCNYSSKETQNLQNQPNAVPKTDDPTQIADNPATYLKALETDSLNTAIRLKLAGYYYSNQDFEKSLYQNHTVLHIDKENLAAIFNLGNIYYDTQQFAQAIKYYEQFLSRDKNNCNVRCDLATCYLSTNNPNKAMSLLRENIKIDASHPQSHYNLSVVLSQTGKTAEADQEMKIYKSLQSGMPR